VKDKNKQRGVTAFSEIILLAKTLNHKTRRSGDEFYVLCQRDAGQSV
jgi:hypothetical protein